MTRLSVHGPKPADMEESIECPYCFERTQVEPASNYAPIYVYCAECDRRFILERTIDGFQALKTENAPCCSDPDRREIEMGLGQED
jgi:hypothetical protein